MNTEKFIHSRIKRIVTDIGDLLRDEYPELEGSELPLDIIVEVVVNNFTEELKNAELQRLIGVKEGIEYCYKCVFETTYNEETKNQIVEALFQRFTNKDE